MYQLCCLSKATIVHMSYAGDDASCILIEYASEDVAISLERMALITRLRGIDRDAQPR